MDLAPSSGTMATHTSVLAPTTFPVRLTPYLGSWIDDKMHGKGIFCYNTGHYIEGNFAANRVDGPACVTFPGGSFLKGLFKKGELNERVLFYNAEKNSWVLENYQAGKLIDIYYEGSGRPVTFGKQHHSDA